ncbi:tyrosine-type recombinase/integrase [Zhengella mangrovi]|uniref:tyrosine-type recombinase/integrase n=1 Tax=Zhengella mangrovi TaxID=1982044 RepID=UPI001FE044E2|nr:tyrosine-type recombinase/integrase [Zhengella mangrovi]
MIQSDFIEFFTANIQNPHTRRAYGRAAVDFMEWCGKRGVTAVSQIHSVDVAAWIEELGHTCSVPTVKQKLSAIRHLFEWMATGQTIPSNPAHNVIGPKHSVRKSKTPVLTAEEVCQLLDSIPTNTIAGMRDRALIGLMTYSFARIGAALVMEVRDVYVQNRRLWVRLHEKGGRAHEIPCHHKLEGYLQAYIDAADLRDDPRGPLFRTIGRQNRLLTNTPLPQSNAFAMIRRRSKLAGIDIPIGCHTFRASGITAYLKNGGTLEEAAAIANHASTRTTQLYDQRRS